MLRLFCRAIYLIQVALLNRNEALADLSLWSHCIKYDYLRVRWCIRPRSQKGQLFGQKRTFLALVEKWYSSLTQRQTVSLYSRYRPLKCYSWLSQNILSPFSTFEIWIQEFSIKFTCLYHEKTPLRLPILSIESDDIKWNLSFRWLQQLPYFVAGPF